MRVQDWLDRPPACHDQRMLCAERRSADSTEVPPVVSPPDVVEDCSIGGFSFNLSGELICGGDDWDGLREWFRQTSVKEEPDDDRRIERTTTLHLWCLQKSIAPIYIGRPKLQTTSFSL